MIRNSIRRGAAWLALLLLVLPAWAVPFQGKSKQSDQPKSQDNKDKDKDNSAAQQKEKPKQEEEPLFGGKLGLKSSHHTRDSASLGFNGIGPDGQVEKKFMDANATSEDVAKAQKVAAYAVNDADLKAFLAEGKLNSKPANQ